VCHTTAGGTPDVAPALGAAQQSELPNAQTAHRHRPSPSGPRSAIESRTIVFFLAGLFFLVVAVKKMKEAGEILTETGNRNRNMRKQHLFPNVSETRSRNTKEKPIAGKISSSSSSLLSTLKIATRQKVGGSTVTGHT